MGWFDGESSSEDEKAPAAPTQSNAHKEEEEEHEDPLDAFMQSLNDAEASSSVKTNTVKTQSTASRMDMQDDLDFIQDTLETTATDAVQSTSQRNSEETPAVPSSYASQERAKRARQALDSTFQKAGASKHSQEIDQDSVPSNPHDWAQVGVPTLSTTHSSTHYVAVRKQFWEPTHSAQGVAWRKEHEVHCSANIDPLLVSSFEPLRSIVTPGTWTALQKQGFHQPTTVQRQTLPVALAGNNVLVTAPTGQGKTLAYVLPMVIHILDQEHLGSEETGPIGLIVVPTRELALQIHKVAKALLAADGGTSKSIIGGQGKYLLYQELKKSGGIEVAVATPGRLLDVLTDTKKKNGLTLDRTTMVVLDEADRCLHMGFEAQLRQILRALRPDCQSLLLSATMSRRVELVAKEWLRSDYVRISVGRSGQSSEHVLQHVMVLPNAEAKTAFILEMAPAFQAVGRCIIFVATREGCEVLAKAICQNPSLDNITVGTLHGDKHQSDRTSTLRAFTKGEISILIASDLAGRGIDVPKVATVVNYDPAKNLDTHVHRIGRAGRLSKDGVQEKGSAYTLLTSKDAEFAHALRESFLREDREVSHELQQLAESSRKAGHVMHSRKPGSRSGLGFQNDEGVSGAPPQKRSRWH